MTYFNIGTNIEKDKSNFLTFIRTLKDMNDKIIDVNYAIYIAWTTFENG